MSVFDPNLPLGVQAVDGFDPHPGPNPPRQICVFCGTPVPHWKPVSAPQLQIEFTTLAVLLDFRGNASTKAKRSKPVSVEQFRCWWSTLHLYANGCLLFAFEFTGKLQVIINVLLFSEAIVAAGGG